MSPAAAALPRLAGVGWATSAAGPSASPGLGPGQHLDIAEQADHKRDGAVGDAFGVVGARRADVARAADARVFLHQRLDALDFLAGEDGDAAPGGDFCSQPGGPIPPGSRSRRPPRSNRQRSEAAVCHLVLGLQASATAAGSRPFQASSARRTLMMALSLSKGGRSGRLIAKVPSDGRSRLRVRRCAPPGAQSRSPHRTHQISGGCVVGNFRPTRRSR